MMEINKVQTTKLSILDGVEIKSATFYDKKFPLHFHQSWSLASIEAGSENISFNGFDFLLNKNALVLIPPYSLHKNWGDKNKRWTYKAIYLNSDLVQNIAEKLKFDYSLLASHPYFVAYSNEKFIITQKFIFKILKNFFSSAMKNEEFTKFSKKNQYPFDELLNYLHLNYNSTITLEKLEKKFKINKFKLIRKFKKEIGLSPLEYQTAIRIENSKQLFYKNIPLTHIALESGFYDQSHFTHSFKKYVGVTPGNYKKYSNILQDW